MNFTGIAIGIIVLLAITTGFVGVAAGQSDKIGDGIDTTTEHNNILVTVNSEQVPERTPNNAERVQDAIEKSQQPVIDHFDTQNGVTVENTFWISNVIEITVNTSETQLESVANHDNIVRLSANGVVSNPEPPKSDSGLATTQSYSLGDYTYGLTQINAPTAWEKYNVSGKGVNVTVIDTGVSNSHPDIKLGGEQANNYKGYWAVFNKSTDTGSDYEDFEGVSAPDPQDDGSGGHGTHVSGTVAGGNATGTNIGVAPNTTLQHALVFDTYKGDFGAEQSDIIRAMQWAVNKETDVISMSLGGSIPYDSSVTATQNARQSGIVVIAASGNAGDGTGQDPSTVNNATSIGATDSNRNIPAFSSGLKYDPTDYYDSTASSWDDPLITPYVVAPGDGVYSADESGSGLTDKSGTSMAAPHVAGMVSLLLDQNPQLTPTQIDLLLERGATQPDGYTSQNTRSGYGIINATESLAMSNPDGHLIIKNSSVNDTTVTGNKIVADLNVTNENIIGDSAARNVTFNVNGSIVDYEEVTVNSEATQRLNFSYPTSESDTGTLNTTISTENDTATYQTEIGEEANLNVSLNASTLNETIVGGQNETFSVTLNNTGGLSVTDDVKFYVNGTLNDSRTDQTVAGGANTTLEFTFTPKTSTSPVHLKVNTSTDNSTYNQSVKTLDSLGINETAPETADQGTRVSLKATYNISEGINRTITPIIERGGSSIFTGEQTVLNATGANNVTISTNDTLPSDETGQVQYNFTTENEYSTEEEATQTISINTGAVYAINAYSVNFDNAVVSPTIENEGSVEETTTVNITQNGTVIGSRSGVSLAPGDSTTLDISISIIETGPGELRVVTPQDRFGAQTTFTKEKESNNPPENTGGGGGGGGSGGGGGGVGGGGGGGGPDNSPPDPQDVKDTLNLVDPMSEGKLADKSDNTQSTNSESDSSEAGNTVQTVTFSKDTKATVTTTDYGEPPETLEEELVNSISVDQKDVKPATPNEIEWESEKDSSSSARGSSDTDDSPPASATEGNEVDVVALSNIKSDQEIDESDTTASITISVDTEDVSNPDQLTVYKEEYVFEAQETQWIELETTATETNDGKIDVTAEADGFSLFAVTEMKQVDGGETPETNETNPETNETVTESETKDSTPGFGAIIALASLLTMTTLLTQRENQ